MGGGHGGLFGMADDEQEEEELVPMKKKHGGLFGSDVGNVKF